MYFGCLFTHTLNMTLFKEAVSHSKKFYVTIQNQRNACKAKLVIQVTPKDVSALSNIFVCSLQSNCEKSLNSAARGICQKSQCKMFYTTEQTVVFFI